MADKMKWFAIRFFFQFRTHGKGRGRDAHFIPGISLVEDRLTVVRARTRALAEKKGHAAAQRYAKDTSWRNAYGQRVKAKLLPFIDSYGLDEQPKDGSEIFSSTEVVSSRESPKRIVRRKIGAVSGASTANMFMASFISDRLTKGFF